MLKFILQPKLPANLSKVELKSTAGQHGIAGGDVKSIPFILPPLAEQRRIVAEVERRLEGAAQVEFALAVAVARASRLRQAVLKSAFEGSWSDNLVDFL